MQDLSALMARSLVAYYQRVQQSVHGLVDPLTDEQLWRRPFPYGNSVGHLLLHLTGNLNYYVGAQIGASGYVRDRPREFTDSELRPKADVLQRFDQAVAMVIATLHAQSADDWTAPYEAVGADGVGDRFTIFLHCAAHADHHAGQMIYLCKQLALKTTAD
jgi:uncharacterized damage-inducible protein DinB